MKWDRVFQILEQSHGVDDFAISLFLVEGLLHVSLPPELASGIKAATEITTHDVDVLKRHLLILFKRDIVSERVKFCAQRQSPLARPHWMLYFFRKVIPTRDEMIFRYGPAAHWYSACWQHVFHAAGLIKHPWVKAQVRSLMDRYFGLEGGVLHRDMAALVTHFKSINMLQEKRRQDSPTTKGAKGRET
jgi:hypothetical protein